MNAKLFKELHRSNPGLQESFVLNSSIDSFTLISKSWVDRSIASLIRLSIWFSLQKNTNLIIYEKNEMSNYEGKLYER